MAAPSTSALATATNDGAIPLTTSFAGKPACTGNHLTMVGILQNEVWLNEPFPASGLTSTECYPTEILASIVVPTSMPAFSPLICPDWYTTATHWSQNYIACCPSSYTLHLTAEPTPAARSAFNATCYSNLPSQTTVTAYDTVSITSTQGYNDPTAQAYAHAIDGYALATGTSQSFSIATGPGPSLSLGGVAVGSSSPAPLTGSASAVSAASTGTNAAVSSAHEGSSTLTTPAIVGIVVGGSAFCLLLALMLWILVLLRRRRGNVAHDAGTQGPHGNSHLSPGQNALGERKSESSFRKELAITESATASPESATALVGPRNPWGTYEPSTRDKSAAPSVPATPYPPVRSRSPAEVGEGLRFEMGEVVQRSELMDEREGERGAREKEERLPTRALAELPGDR